MTVRIPIRSCRRHPAAATLALLFAGAALLAAGCSSNQILSREPPPVSCSARRLSLSASLYGEARVQMAKHYRERTAQTLHFAYYLSSDAIQLARSTRGCPDYNDAVKGQAINLIRTSRLLRILAVTNMRDPDPLVTMTLLQDRYVDLFVNRDIE